MINIQIFFRIFVYYLYTLSKIYNTIITEEELLDYFLRLKEVFGFECSIYRRDDKYTTYSAYYNSKRIPITYYIKAFFPYSIISINSEIEKEINAIIHRINMIYDVKVNKKYDERDTLFAYKKYFVFTFE